MVKKENFKDLMEVRWLEELWPALASPQMHKVYHSLRHEKMKGYKILPDYKDTFNAFKFTPWDKVRVVILDEQPHQRQLAHGLAYSTQSDICPPSLKNILTEVENDVYDGFNLIRSITHDLTPWAEQGVLLLNTALTVQLGWPGSHNYLWEYFTEYVLKKLSANKTGIVYLIWGDKVQKYKPFINEKFNHILEAAHPSTRDFLGCKHFSKTNDILVDMNGEDAKIEW